MRHETGSHPEPCPEVYDGKVVLDDVTLAFLPGAKIGVVGPNGMGKSTLLRMMAGLEQPSNGEVRLMPGYTVGILAQEPALDEDKTVLGNVEEGVAETKALIERYNEVAAKMAADYSDDLLEELGGLQEQLDHRDAWDLDSRIDQAMDALRCPPPDAEVARCPAASGAGWHCAGCCSPSGTCCCSTSRPTTWTRKASPGWNSTWTHTRHGGGGHPRPVFPGQRGRWILELDRGRAYPYEGNYSTYLENKAARMKVKGQQDAKLAGGWHDELEWVRSNARAAQTKSRARLDRYERWLPRPGVPAGWTSSGSRSRRARGWAAWWSRPSTWPGFDDRTLIDGLELQPAAATGSSGSSGRTAWARPRCSR